jgi:phage terminase large subunit GpA-like protein
MRASAAASRLEWQKLRERNEALDCRVYARAAAWIAGADRWSEARWADLEAQLGSSGEDDREASAPAAAGAIRPVRQVLRRRSLRSSYMG